MKVKLHSRENLNDSKGHTDKMDKLLREANSLVKVTAYKRSRRDPSEAAMQDINGMLFDAMAKENPELFEQVRRFLSSKKEEL